MTPAGTVVDAPGAVPHPDDRDTDDALRVLVRLSPFDPEAGCACGRRGGCAALAGVATALGTPRTTWCSVAVDVARPPRTGDRVRLALPQPPNEAWRSLSVVLFLSLGALLLAAGTTTMLVRGLSDPVAEAVVLVVSLGALAVVVARLRDLDDMLISPAAPSAIALPRVIAIESPRPAGLDDGVASAGCGSVHPILDCAADARAATGRPSQRHGGAGAGHEGER